MIKNETRRDFLKVSGSVAGALTLGFYVPGRNLSAAAQSTTARLNAWVRIGTDNTITIMCARSEMGQGVYTSMPMLVAEELEVDPSKIRVEFAPAAGVYTNVLLGGQRTGGSTSVRDAWEKLRMAGASARIMLVSAAANEWNVDPARCKALDGVITGPGGKKTTYGQVVAKAAAMEVPTDVPLKPSTRFKVIGNPRQMRLDTAAKVKGQAQFGIDTRIPGMLYAAVAMSPAIGGKVASFDDSRSRAVSGVKAIVQYSRGLAVVADFYWQAKKAKDLLQIRWDGGPNAGNDQKSIWEGIRAASEQPGVVFRELGDVEAGMRQVEHKFDAVYQLPFLAHLTMEPQNTTADVRADKAIIITPTQFQQLVPHVVAGVTGLNPEQVEVHTTFLGGGNGRRVEVDYVIDATEISKAVGAPVKMVWSREDDMTHDFYRPANLMKLSAGLDASGKPVAMRFHSTGPSISARLFPGLVNDGIDPIAAKGIDNFLYDTPNIRVTYQMHDTGVTPGYWRGVSRSLNTVALECFVDELANAAGKDPIHYRLDMLDMGSTRHQLPDLSAGVAVGARMKRVLEEVRAKSGWGRLLPSNRGMGVAVMEGCNTIIAMVAEVNVSSSYDVTVEKVTAVVDAGTLVHPHQALAQIQGKIIVGLSTCMWGEITIRNGGVEQTNFDTYRVARMHEAPKVLDINFIRSDSEPGGLGEPVAAVIQPAIGNAIFAACGKRCRTLPFSPENIRGFA